MAGTKALSVVAATNRPNDIEPALRRPGRLDREIQFSPPDAEVDLVYLHQDMKPVKSDAAIFPFHLSPHVWVQPPSYVRCTSHDVQPCR